MAELVELSPLPSVGHTLPPVSLKLGDLVHVTSPFPEPTESISDLSTVYPETVKEPENSVFHSEKAAQELFTPVKTRSEFDDVWFLPARYQLARLCLIPLSLLWGLTILLSIVSIALNPEDKPLQTAAAVNLGLSLPITSWVTLQACSIRADHLWIHEIWVWAMTWPIVLVLHLCTFLPYTLTSRPLRPWPDLPECYTIPGGPCSPSDGQTYQLLLVRQMNRGLFITGIVALGLEVAALLMLFAMRIYPAIKYPHRKLWKKSVYTSLNLWKFVPFWDLWVPERSAKTGDEPRPETPPLTAKEQKRIAKKAQERDKEPEAGRVLRELSAFV